MHLEILRNIGSSIGNLVGIYASYKHCNNIKFLINLETKTPKLQPLKVITNKSIYSLKFYRFEGKFFEIIRLNNERKFNYQMNNSLFNLSTSTYEFNLHHERARHN